MREARRGRAPRCSSPRSATGASAALEGADAVDVVLEKPVTRRGPRAGARARRRGRDEAPAARSRSLVACRERRRRRRSPSRCSSAATARSTRGRSPRSAGSLALAAALVRARRAERHPPARARSCAARSRSRAAASAARCAVAAPQRARRPRLHVQPHVARARELRRGEPPAHRGARARATSTRIRSLAAAIDAKDPYTRGHAERVAALAVEIGRELGLAPDALAGARVRGDPPRHRQDRRSRTRSSRSASAARARGDGARPGDHPRDRRGDRRRRRVPAAPRCPRSGSHHERWDGDGYPDRLARRGDPARRADREHRGHLGRLHLPPPVPGRARRSGRVVAILAGLRGTQIDPGVHDALVAVLRRRAGRARVRPPRATPPAPWRGARRAARLPSSAVRLSSPHDDAPAAPASRPPPRSRRSRPAPRTRPRAASIPDPARLALSLDGGFARRDRRRRAARARSALARSSTWPAGSSRSSSAAQRDRAPRAPALAAPPRRAGRSGGSSSASELPGRALAATPTSRCSSAQGVTGPLVAPIAQTALGDLRLGAKLPRARRRGAVRDRARRPRSTCALPTGDGDAFTRDGLVVVPGVDRDAHVRARARSTRSSGYVHPRARASTRSSSCTTAHLVARRPRSDLPAGSAPLQRWRAIAEVERRVAARQRPRRPSGTARRSPPARACARSLSRPARGGAGRRHRPRRRPGTAASRGASSAACGSRSTRRARSRARRRERPGPRSRRRPERARTPARDVPGPAELDGCPDRDGDEIPDREDRCPDQPGPAAREGCPVAEDEPLVEIETRAALAQGRDPVRHRAGHPASSESFPRARRRSAGSWRRTPSCAGCASRGTPTTSGSDAYNKDLSDRRARTVVRYLVGARASRRERLEPAGFGDERPVASNATALGRAKNRRVEFTIVDRNAAR